MALKYNINIGKNGEYFYITDYMPKNKKGEKSSEFMKYSEMILKYKKGDRQTISFFTRLLSNIIYDYFYLYDLILPVPPSNSYLDVYPNGAVCLFLSAFGLIGTLDGAIVCSKGHRPGHIDGIRAKKDDLKYISFKDRGNFESKNIIIFDEIITTGATFGYIKEALLKRGANSVIGLFLGKTAGGGKYL